MKKWKNNPIVIKNLHYHILLQFRALSWILFCWIRHWKCKSPVKSNSTVGITLVMNFKNMNNDMCPPTFCPFSLMASDILFNTLACLHGWTVGIVIPSMNGNRSMVKVSLMYYFWISSLISSLLMGFPSKSVALKNILGVW